MVGKINFHLYLISSFLRELMAYYVLKGIKDKITFLILEAFFKFCLIHYAIFEH